MKPHTHTNNALAIGGNVAVTLLLAYLWLGLGHGGAGNLLVFLHWLIVLLNVATFAVVTADEKTPERWVHSGPTWRGLRIALLVGRVSAMAWLGYYVLPVFYLGGVFLLTCAKATARDRAEEKRQAALDPLGRLADAMTRAARK